jgi:putative ubiquitin-RnfH superfamily antitoxin RatB of RatAB toxin-antitoxin module
MADLTVDVWLYGALKRYGGEAKQGSFANLQVRLPEGSTMADLLSSLGVPAEERGITFVNAQLSAMPGLQPDKGYLLHDGDRIGIFDPKSMWPFQYRHGAAMTEEMSRATAAERDQGMHLMFKK